MGQLWAALYDIKRGQPREESRGFPSRELTPQVSTSPRPSEEVPGPHGASVRGQGNWLSGHSSRAQFW